MAQKRSRYARPCNCRILAVNERGTELDVIAKTAIERTSYERLAKQSYQPMTKQFGPARGVAIVIDNDSGQITTTWSPLGLDEKVMSHARRSLERYLPSDLVRAWEQAQRAAVKPAPRK